MQSQGADACAACSLLKRGERKEEERWMNPKVEERVKPQLHCHIPPLK
jgi:hypothetical protein